jgi:RNA-directed DNA polymerase
VEIPKGNGATRPLGIPAVKDRIVKKAVLTVAEPIFEVQFLDASFGFRPGRGAKGALRKVDEHLVEGFTHVVDADIKGRFDSIPHDKLLARVSESIADGRILGLLEGWMKQDIMSEAGRWKPTVGTPQGAVISPLLADIYLHPLDCLLTEQGFRMVRYADDFVVLCPNGEQAAKALSLIEAWTQENGLSLHPDKVHVGDCRVEGEGFEFLGYRFEAGKRWVRNKSYAKLKERVREFTPRSCGCCMDVVISNLNKTLKGWYGYFKQANKITFRFVDGFVRRRLRAILLNRNKRKGVGKSYGCHKRWPNVYFAKAGLFSLVKAHSLDVLKSRDLFSQNAPKLRY